ncbi:MAG: rhodanese-like domain-containing protein [Deltaproteobacteria bacterium]|nr:rhodanese-like domain-containing protein [Deltaproteobacteria bacterium]MBW2662515.1 rhodanese-like domain-containing protein [Deltaproteobacteria bacterium]
MNQKMRLAGCMCIMILITVFCLFDNVYAEELRDYLNEAKSVVGAENIILPKIAQDMIKADPGVMVIDVCEPNEYEKGHVKGALLMPRGLIEFKIRKNDIYPDINKGRMPTLDTPIITICKMGGRALLAAKVLKQMGYKNVKAIKGGYKGWMAARLPLEQ